MASGAFVNVRVAESFPDVATPYPDVRLAVIRDVTEDVYRGAHQYVGADAVVGFKFITRQGVVSMGSGRLRR